MEVREAAYSWATLFLQLKEESDCRPATLALYTWHIGAFCTWLDDQGVQLAADQVRAYMREIAISGHAEETRLNYHRIIKNLCRFLVARDLLDGDPFAGADRIRPPRIHRRRVPTYTMSEVVRLLRATHVQAANKRCPELTRQRWSADGFLAREALQGRALVVLLTDSALRASEVCRLTCGQMRRHELVVESKGGHEDVAFISAATRGVLRELAGNRPDTDPLFRNRDGHAYSVPALRMLLRRLAKRAGVTLPPRPLHAFRHYAARQWVKRKVPDLIIQQWMRHADLSTTQIYTQLDVDELTVLHEAASGAASLLDAATEE